VRILPAVSSISICSATWQHGQHRARVAPGCRRRHQQSARVAKGSRPAVHTPGRVCTFSRARLPTISSLVLAEDSLEVSAPASQSVRGRHLDGVGALGRAAERPSSERRPRRLRPRVHSCALTTQTCSVLPWGRKKKKRSKSTLSRWRQLGNQVLFQGWGQQRLRWREPPGCRQPARSTTARRMPSGSRLGRSTINTTFACESDTECMF